MSANFLAFSAFSVFRLRPPEVDFLNIPTPKFMSSDEQFTRIAQFKTEEVFYVFTYSNFNIRFFLQEEVPI